jgi:16S rRNA (adenine1518-N6/adenine1519-N6)-dimethyltransferase
MKLSEMKQALTANDIQLTKSLGQNFLHDSNQLRRIIETAEVTKGDKILEVGPGLGPLTGLLLEKAGEVLAIEKDARLVAVLRQRFQSSQSLTLLHDDALDYLRREDHDWSDWKLVSNLPYSVASPILVELAQSPRRPRRMVATLQLEVARRLMAAPGEEDYGILTLLVQLNYQPEGLFKIPAGCFFPEPEVDSACVCLSRRPAAPLTLDEQKTFTRVVKRGFSQRRKMMLKLLKSEWDPGQLESAFQRLGLSPQIRAEKVSVEKFVELTRSLHAAT